MPLLKAFDNKTQLSYRSGSDNTVTISFQKGGQDKKVTAVVFSDSAVTKIEQANIETEKKE